MSERTFFNMRYAYPGFTLILAFIIINPYLVQLLSIESELNAIFLGVGAIIGLSPLGILSSQPWHLFLNCYRLTQDSHRDSSTTYLRKTLKRDKLKLKSVGKEERRKLLIIRDYLYHYYSSKLEKDKINMVHIRTFLSRRWDIINMIGSGFTSFILGTALGVIYKELYFKNLSYMILSNETIIIHPSNKTIEHVTKIIFERTTMIDSLPPNYYYYVEALIVLLFFMALFSIKWVNLERQNFIVSMFNEWEINSGIIKTGFPEDIKYDNSLDQNHDNH